MILGSKPQRHKQQVQKLNTELAAKNQHIKNLSAEIRELQQGNDLIEEKAREELGFLKKDETFYLIWMNSHDTAFCSGLGRRR